MMFSNTSTPPFRCRIGYDNKVILSRSPWLCHKFLRLIIVLYYNSKLLLVIFAALSYIDNHVNKKK